MARDNAARGLALSAVRVTINQGHVFATTQIRDSYFVTNPQELVEGIYIFCMSELQRYENSKWNNRAVIMFSNSDTINAENVVIDKSNFTAVLKKYAGNDDAQSLFNYIDTIQEFPNGVVYVGEQGSQDSWRIKQNGQGLQFCRYQNGGYFEIYNVENSSTTDNYFINAPEGRLAYVTEDKAIHTLIKSSTDLKGCQLNNVNGRISMLNNGTIASYNPIGDKRLVDINKITEEDGILGATELKTYSQEFVISKNMLVFGVNEYYITECKKDTTMRLYITDKVTGNLLAQSCSLGQFYGGKGKLVNVGVNIIDLSEALPILSGKDVLLHADFTETVKIQGKIMNNGSGDRFNIRFNSYVQDLNEENIATREWTNTNIAVQQDGKDYLSKVVHDKTADSYNFTFGNDKLSKVNFTPSTVDITEKSKDGLKTSNLSIAGNYVNMTSNDGFIEVGDSSATISCKNVNISAETTMRLYHRETDYAIDLDKDGVGINIGDSMLAVKADGNIKMTGKVNINDHPIVQDGDGKSFLANNGNYIAVTGGSGWDMEVDLSAKENINVVTKTEPTSYTEVTKVAFDRENKWVVNEFIEIQTYQSPAHDISMCNYFTIKGKPDVTNYTDNSVKFILRETKRIDESVINTPCVACTESTDIYNKLATPIASDSQFGLWCNCLNDPYGYVPNDHFDITFYSGETIVTSVPLFNGKSGLLNPAMIPPSNQADARFNEITMYDIDGAGKVDTKTPSIVYDSPEFGELGIFGATAIKGTEVNIGNILSQFKIYSSEKNTVKSTYIGDQNLIEICSKCDETPLTTTLFGTKFPVDKTQDLVGFIFMTGKSASLKVKLTRMFDEVVMLEQTFSFPKATSESANPSYAIISDGRGAFPNLSATNYYMEVTLLSGLIYGTGDTPFCTAVLGTIVDDSLVCKSSIEGQVKVKTNPKEFRIESSKIESMVHANDFNCTEITIPKTDTHGTAILGVSDNIFSPSDAMPIYVEANLTDLGYGNFVSEDGLTQRPIYMSPNNIESWRVFRKKEMVIHPTEMPPVQKKAFNSQLMINMNDEMEWVKSQFDDNCVYISKTHRINCTNASSFIFEIFVSETWFEVGKFSL